MPSSQAVEEFRAVLDSVYGVYLDSKSGFDLIVREFDRLRLESLRRLPDRSPKKLDAAKIIYGHGAPDDPGAYALHICTQKEYRERNLKDGQNDHVIGNLCMVLLYQYWEDYYRGRIAAELNLDRRALEVPVMGDLRLLRRSIIHHRAVALPELVKCETIPWFEEGELISLTRKQVEHVIFLVKTALDDIAKESQV